MTEKRFGIDKDGRTILDSIDDSYCECVDGYEAKQYCEKLNELNDENEQLHRINEENKERIYSIGKELAKLRLIKKNLRKIKNQWNWIMESVDYD